MGVWVVFARILEDMDPIPAGVSSITPQLMIVVVASESLSRYKPSYKFSLSAKG